jgi:NADP-dependent 3-hydroxy acid dehydrogenase YdfG
MELTSRTIAITGASSGIGAAIARSIVDAGGNVVLGARRVNKLEQLADELGADDRVHVAALDVTEWESNVAFMTSARERFGQVHGLIANAGFGAPRGFLESDPGHWRDMVLTNVLGAAYSIRAALPALTETHGHVVVTSSVAGRRVLPGSLYSATKHAVTAMAEALRLEVAEQGVRVTSLEPGMVDTPFFDNGTPEWALHPEDIADGVLYALTQPARATVSSLTIRPTAQVT